MASSSWLLLGQTNDASESGKTSSVIDDKSSAGDPIPSAP
jgi:hypothetical protein